MDGSLQEHLGSLAVWGIEHRPDISCHLTPHRLAGNIGTGILLQVELATLPWDTAQNCPPGCPKSFVIIADHQLDAIRPRSFSAFRKAFQWLSCSLNDTDTPNTWRCPPGSIPVATKTAASRTWLLSRTFS